jgi:hypothetical protein
MCRVGGVTKEVTLNNFKCLPEAMEIESKIKENGGILIFGD